MNKFLMILPIVAVLAGCETQEQNQIGGAAAGAILGASVSSSDDKAKGAIIGGLAGLAAGSLIKGQTDTQGRCLYERPDGTRYYAAC